MSWYESGSREEQAVSGVPPRGTEIASTVMRRVTNRRSNDMLPRTGRCAFCGEALDLTKTHLRVRNGLRIVATYHDNIICASYAYGNDVCWVYPSEYGFPHVTPRVAHAVS